MRVVIVGGGSIGLCSALYLAARGASVCVLDAQRPGEGASRHNAGWIAPSLSAPVPAPGAVRQSLRWMLRRDSPLYVRPSWDPHLAKFMVQMLRNSTPANFAAGLRAQIALNERTFELFDELREHGLDYEEHREGMVQVFRTQESLDSHIEESTLVRELGGPDFEVLTRSEVHELSPGLSGSVVGGISCPDERFIDPESYCQELITACVDLGVEFVERQPMVLSAESDGVVAVGQGCRMKADHYVVAAGVWSGQVVRRLGARLPLQAGKGYGFDLAPDVPPRARSLYLSEAKVAVTPLVGATRFAGTMAFGGLDASVDARRARGILTSAEPYFDEWKPPVGVEAWAGLRPMTPDGLPIMGALPHHPTVTVATGHAMLGLTLGPVTGDFVARRIFGEPLPAYALPFGLERFRKPPRGES